jgi:hypothetical protein
MSEIETHISHRGDKTMVLNRYINISIIGILGVALVLSSASCGTLKTQGNAKSEVAKPKTIETVMGTTYTYKDMEGLAGDANLIVLGTVTEIQPSFEAPVTVVIKGEQAAEEFRIANPGVQYQIVSEDISDEDFKKTQEEAEKKRFIYTNYVITVSKYYKGANDSKIVIARQMGGQVGDREMRVQDLEPLKLNELIVLFLRRNPTKNEENTFLITGLEQGKYKIDIDKDQATNKDPAKSKKFSDLEKEIIDIATKQPNRVETY